MGVYDLVLLDSFDHYASAMGYTKFVQWNADIHNDGRTNRCLVVPQFYTTYKAFCRVTELCVGMALWTPDLSIGRWTALGCGPSGIPEVVLQHSPDGFLSCVVSGNGSITSECPVLTAFTWYYIELYVSHDNVAKTVTLRLYVNENEVASGTVSLGSTYTPAGFSYLSFHHGVTGGVNDRVDDLYITTGERLGDVKIYVIRPNGAGVSSAWASSTGREGWQDINENQVDGDSSYIYTTNAGAEHVVNLEDLSQYGEIKGVQTNVIAKKLDAGSAAIQVVSRFNGVNYYTSNQRPSYGSYRDFTMAYRLNPNTGVAFTVDDITWMQAGVSRTA